MAGESSAKICSVCGIDCSDKQRTTKDAQGRYTCAECIIKAKETKSVQVATSKPKAPAAAAPSAEAEDNNAFLLNLGGKAQAMDGGKACPKCEAVLNQRDMLCMACGFNLETGQRIRVKIEKAKVPQGEKKSGPQQLSPAMVAAIVIGIAALAGGAAWYFGYI